jgi:hypothetical protein
MYSCIGRFFIVFLVLLLCLPTHAALAKKSHTQVGFNKNKDQVEVNLRRCGTKNCFVIQVAAGGSIKTTFYVTMSIGTDWTVWKDRLAMSFRLQGNVSAALPDVRIPPEAIPTKQAVQQRIKDAVQVAFQAIPAKILFTMSAIERQRITDEASAKEIKRIEEETIQKIISSNRLTPKVTGSAQALLGLHLTETFCKNKPPCIQSAAQASVTIPIVGSGSSNAQGQATVGVCFAKKNEDCTLSPLGIDLGSGSAISTSIGIGYNSKNNKPHGILSVNGKIGVLETQVDCVTVSRLCDQVSASAKVRISF